MFIAEIGINHNGSLEIAKQLIRIASNCGADIVKFQKRNPDVCIPNNQKDIVKNTIFGEMRYIDYKYRIEFGRAEYDEIDKYCRKLGIKWTASVWDKDSVDFISNYDVPFLKIPSALITNTELINHINKTNREVIMAAGMSEVDEIYNTAKSIVNLKAILHCNSSYPSANNELDLNFISTLRRMFPKVEIGYSGHENGYIPTIVAKSLGVSIIERHITLDKKMIGTDHQSSLNPSELQQLISDLKIVDDSLGKLVKPVYNSEISIKEKLRY